MDDPFESRLRRRRVSLSDIQRSVERDEVQDGVQFVRTRLPRELPPVVRRAIGADRIVYHLEEIRDHANHSLRWRLPGALAEESRRPCAAGNAHNEGWSRVSAVAIPLVGSKIESGIGRELQAGYEKAADSPDAGSRRTADAASLLPLALSASASAGYGGVGNRVPELGERSVRPGPTRRASIRKRSTMNTARPTSRAASPTSRRMNRPRSPHLLRPGAQRRRPFPLTGHGRQRLVRARVLGRNELWRPHGQYYDSGYIGENIAYGYPSPFSAMFHGWMCSEDTVPTS